MLLVSSEFRECSTTTVHTSTNKFMVLLYSTARLYDTLALVPVRVLLQSMLEPECGSAVGKEIP